MDIYSNTDWNTVEPVPCWQSYQQGMKRSVIIPPGIIVNCFKITSLLMSSKSTVYPLKYGMIEEIK